MPHWQLEAAAPARGARGRSESKSPANLMMLGLAAGVGPVTQSGVASDSALAAELPGPTAAAGPARRRGPPACHRHRR